MAKVDAKAATKQGKRADEQAEKTDHESRFAPFADLGFRIRDRAPNGLDDWHWG